jgi:hypothetical protein
MALEEGSIAEPMRASVAQAASNESSFILVSLSAFGDQFLRHGFDSCQIDQQPERCNLPVSAWLAHRFACSAGTTPRQQAERARRSRNPGTRQSPLVAF